MSSLSFFAHSTQLPEESLKLEMCCLDYIHFDFFFQKRNGIAFTCHKNSRLETIQKVVLKKFFGKFDFRNVHRLHREIGQLCCNFTLCYLEQNFTKMMFSNYKFA